MCENILKVRAHRLAKTLWLGQSVPCQSSERPGSARPASLTISRGVCIIGAQPTQRPLRGSDNLMKFCCHGGRVPVDAARAIMGTVFDNLLNDDNKDDKGGDDGASVRSASELAHSVASRGGTSVQVRFVAAVCAWQSPGRTVHVMEGVWVGVGK